MNLILDPGLAFGTGSHPSTQLCLAWLDENLRGGDDVLDYGCGSGILAIAAAKLGAHRVAGIDIDPQAIDASRQNALLNHCSEAQLQFHDTGDAARTGRTGEIDAISADVIVANILAGPLIVLEPHTDARCATCSSDRAFGDINRTGRRSGANVSARI